MATPQIIGKESLIISINHSIHINKVLSITQKRSKIIPDTHALCTVIKDQVLSIAEYQMSYFQTVHASHPADLINNIPYDTVQFQLETYK